MINASTLSLILLFVAMGAVRFASGRLFVAKHSPKIFWGCVVAVLALQDYWAYAQFRLWQSVEPSKYLLPPYNGWGYFLQYVGWRLFAPYLISLVIAFIFFYLAKFFNSRRDFNLFYNEEYYFIALSFFLSGHPGWIIYGVLITLAAIATITFRHFILHKTEKFSLYYFWFPIAAIAIIIIDLLRSSFEVISKLGI